VLAAGSYQAAKHWQSSASLWSYTAAMNDQAWPAFMGLGDERRAKQDLAAAYRWYMRAAALRPALISTPHHRDAVVEILIKQGRYPEALAAIDRALQDTGLRSAKETRLQTVSGIQWAKRIAHELQVAGRDDEGLQWLGTALTQRTGEVTVTDDRLAEPAARTQTLEETSN